MAIAEHRATLSIEVAYSPRAGETRLVPLSLAEGACVLQALQASRLLEEFSELDPAHLQVGIWGKLRSLADPLRDRDRVEIYRPLQVDPKEARRQRYRSQRKR